ncbi:MAG: hypothetical protein LBN03_01380 [Bifidobacteriaceae bacterium]|jgi:RNA polymerase-interacting CarD/CdnL/TRCF family regulator|nr:hypothetical protein [Bifidobacteriaceae bacterium]
MKVKVGKHLVHPIFGVCEILEVFNDDLNGEEVEFVSMKSITENMEHILPYARLEEYGLRPVVKKADLEELYKLMKKAKADIKLTGAKSFKVNTERSKTGLPEDMIISLSSLSIRHSTDALIPTERQLLMHLRKKFIHELSISLKTDLNTAEKKFNLALIEVIPKEAKIAYEEALTHIALKNNVKN